MTTLAFDYLPAPGRERPDFTIFNYPDATLTDTSVEEIELDQALSLAGRQGRDLLGVGIENIMVEMETEWQTLAFGTDHRIDLAQQLNTRTGAFGHAEPERLWGMQARAAAASIASGTDAGGNFAVFDPHFEFPHVLGEGFLYVAPRLFWRTQNDLDASLAVNALNAKISSISVRLNFPIFIELLERFADVTLL